MKPTVEQLGNLLSLRRDERPEDGYWQDFLCEFHQKQRERSVKKPALVSLFGRTSAWFSEAGPSKWAYGAGLAYAAFAVGLLLSPREAGVEITPPAPVSHEVIQVVPPPVEQLDRLDLSPSTQGSAGEQVF